MASNGDGSPPAKRARLTFAENVEVLVGDDLIKFYVHPSIVCQRSPFFEAACERWKKAGEPVDMVHDDPITFNDYLQCVYTDEAPQEEDFQKTMRRNVEA
ncbi:hypothetical protein LTR85_001119 [Meristemomyces frigidus]|nr:hypothetical protein LTR85_001119 [Meristemomyces frigidus]